MLVLSLKLILAHLFGDFLFQPNQWVNNKKAHKIKSKYLYYHIAIHLVLLLIATQFQTRYYGAIIILIISHFIIDVGKLYLDKGKRSKLLFFLDQALHFIVIAGIVYYYHPYSIAIGKIYEPKTLLLIIALVSVTYVTAVILRVLLSKWNYNNSASSAVISEDTNNAGKYIGILERLFIFFFVVMNLWEGIGFLLAAKSIFRFGDLKDAKDIKLTEYILIGTLLSFGIGIFCAISYKYLLTLM